LKLPARCRRDERTEQHDGAAHGKEQLGDFHDVLRDVDLSTAAFNAVRQQILATQVTEPTHASSPFAA
jgi:hypothetical protein